MNAQEHYSEEPVDLDSFYRELEREGFDVKVTFPGVLRALTPNLGMSSEFSRGFAELAGIKVEDEEGKVYCTPLEADYRGDVGEELDNLVKERYDASYLDFGLRHPHRGLDF